MHSYRHKYYSPESISDVPKTQVPESRSKNDLLQKLTSLSQNSQEQQRRIQDQLQKPLDQTQHTNLNEQAQKILEIQKSLSTLTDLLGKRPDGVMSFAEYQNFHRQILSLQAQLPKTIMERMNTGARIIEETHHILRDILGKNTDTATDVQARDPFTLSEHQEGRSIQTISEVFASLLPQPRPEIDNLLVELTHLSSMKQTSLLMRAAKTIEDMLSSALKGMEKGTRQPSRTSVDLRTLRNILHSAQENKDPSALFEGLYKALTEGQDALNSAKNITEAPTRTTKASKEEVGATKENTLGDMRERTEMDIPAAMEAVGYRLMNLRNVPAEIGATPSPLTRENIIKGSYVGDLYKMDPDGRAESISQTFFVPSQHTSVNINTITITGKHSFTYRERDKIYTVEARSQEGVQTRKVKVPEDLTAILSAVTRLPASERNTHLDPIYKTIRSQLGSNTYFGVHRGEIVIKTMPSR